MLPLVLLAMVLVLELRLYVVMVQPVVLERYLALFFLLLLILRVKYAMIPANMIASHCETFCTVPDRLQWKTFASEIFSNPLIPLIPLIIF